jgi:hypothetical protein
MAYEDNPHDNSSTQMVKKQKYSQLKICHQNLKNHCYEEYVNIDKLTLLKDINLAEKWKGEKEDRKIQN